MAGTKSVFHLIGHPAPSREEFEEIIMVEVFIEEMYGSD
jgi:hypothetical protein